MQISKFFALSCLTILAGFQPHATTASQSVAPEQVIVAPNLGKEEMPRQEVPEVNWELVDAYVIHSTPPPKEVQAIRGRCAVLIYPSEEQIKAIKEELGDSDAETVGDDGSFYLSDAIKSLEALKVPQVVAKRRYLRLADHAGLIIDLRKDGAPYFNLLLCSTSKQPAFRSPIDANKEFIAAYFRPARKKLPKKQVTFGSRPTTPNHHINRTPPLRGGSGYPER